MLNGSKNIWNFLLSKKLEEIDKHQNKLITRKNMK